VGLDAVIAFEFLASIFVMILYDYEIAALHGSGLQKIKDGEQAASHNRA
jgi:hypothetical protein